MSDLASKGTHSNEAGSGALIRQLAASDKETRDKGVAVLTKWLKLKDHVSEEDLLKIWKGLFYCMWHSDKSPVQSELARSLSAILLDLGDELVLTFLSAFFITMRREWSGIDVLRLDKFYLLVRMFLRRSFELLDTRRWDPQIVLTVAQCFASEGFSCAGEKARSIGFSLHLSDIFVGEIAQSVGAKKHVTELLLPLLNILASENDKRVLMRLQEAVFLGYLRHVSRLEEEEAEQEAAHVGTIADSLFEAAGSKETPAYNRKLLFDTHRRFSQHLAKQGGERRTASKSDKGQQTAERSPDRGDGHVKGPGGKAKEGSGEVEHTEGGESHKPEAGEGSEEAGASNTSSPGGSSASPEAKQKKRVQRSLVGSMEEETGGEEDGDVVQAGGSGELVGGSERSSTIGGEGVSEDAGDTVGGGGNEVEGVEEKEAQVEKKKGSSTKQRLAEVRALMRNSAGTTPHGKKRTRLMAEALAGGEEGDEAESPEEGAGSPEGMSPPPPSLLRLAAQIGSSDGFQTPEKHIVDAFSSAGFYTQDYVREGNEGDKEGEEDDEWENEGGKEGDGGKEGEDAGLVEEVAGARGKKQKKGAQSLDGDGKKGKGKQGKRERKVRFVLNKNLEFEHGSAPAPPTVRTPPCSAPRGSALKPGTKPGPINMKKLISATETSPSQMTADGRKKRKNNPVRAAGLSPPQSLTTRFAYMS